MIFNPFCSTVPKTTLKIYANIFCFNPVSANPTKWSPQGVCEHFVGLTLKG